MQVWPAVFVWQIVSIDTAPRRGISDVAVPHKAFDMMKNFQLIKDAIDAIVSVYKVRLESLIKMRSSCSNDTLVCSYYIVSVYYVKITIQGVRKYSTIKHSIQFICL